MYSNQLKPININYTNICNNLVKKFKKEYYQRQFDLNKDNMKGTWKTKQEVCNIGSLKQSASELQA